MDSTENQVVPEFQELSKRKSTGASYAGVPVAAHGGGEPAIPYDAHLDDAHLDDTHLDDTNLPPLPTLPEDVPYASQEDLAMMAADIGTDKDMQLPSSQVSSQQVTSAQNMISKFSSSTSGPSFSNCQIGTINFIVKK